MVSSADGVTDDLKFFYFMFSVNFMVHVKTDDQNIDETLMTHDQKIRWYIDVAYPTLIYNQ